ncbi:MAG: hypothetical protein JW913_02295 [Chitinispirillaceae bacterium]|nr:hypothetical protein [Chitinispirillaceae bacterium]
MIKKYDSLVLLYSQAMVKFDTLLMNPKCRVCHGKDQRLAAKKFEWSTTEHAIGKGFAAALGKSSCARCHTGHGFITQTVDGKPKTDIDTLNMSNINCRTCHKIHTAYDTTDWDLSTVKKAGLAAKPADSINMGKGNLCVNCHQALSINPIDTATAPDSFKVTSRFFGAHFGPQTNILIGTGGCESICSTTTKPTVFPLTSVENGCVACHVSNADGENHLFMPSKRAVAAVNSSINVDTTRAKVDTLLAELRDSLVARNIIKKDSTAKIGFSLVPGTAGTMFPKAVAGACWNYLFIRQDKSHGVHNSPYVLWLLEYSIKVLKE